MFQKLTTKKIAVTGILLALEIIFQIIGNYLQIGPVNINLSLVTVALAAVICGPISGAILGFFNGVVVLFSPSTIAIFMPISVGGTILTCLSKCTIAGFLAGLFFELLRKINRTTALIGASLLVPMINTAFFIVYSLIFFRPFLESGVGDTYPNASAYLILGVVAYNFIFELLACTILTPLIGNVLLSREQKHI
ncbi:MAG TPA: ECF transporter S component [Erysipelotrichaceae bacterium]|nr:ECF transporter S component [Erysipelotrichaceae bacterium]